MIINENLWSLSCTFIFKWAFMQMSYRHTNLGLILNLNFNPAFTQMNMRYTNLAYR